MYIKSTYIGYNRGDIYIYRLNRLEESVAAYNDALRIDPFFVEAYNGRGKRPDGLWPRAGEYSWQVSNVYNTARLWAVPLFSLVTVMSDRI